ncbi:ABC transporter permease [Limibacterium fermenti]|uniref:ABC transporter permease n=1 Tax=Limibacterium fermenti TaxID=3229863 RepID=UPI000E9FF267|nr:hypothetical protein [Porphyromonadaceae bacterium]
MIRHLFKVIWNERKHNIGVWIELLLVGLFLWYMVDYMYVSLTNYFEPLGFDTEHTYIMRLGLLNESSPEYIKDIPEDARVGYLHTALERMQHNPMVEAASISFVSSPHNGGNRSQNIYHDTLTIQGVLHRKVTPDFFRVFRYQSKNGSIDELVRALERNELVISPDVEKKLFKNSESAVGQFVSFEQSDSAQMYRVGAVSTVIRYDNFSSWSSYYADAINDESLGAFSDGYISILEFCVRVKPEEDHDFILRFRQDMTQQLRLGNYYLSEIQSIPANKKAFQKDNINDLQIRFFIILFLLVNIFLGITGTFWFRTQYRRGEIGVRIAVGETSKGALRLYYAEGLLLLTLAIVPVMALFAFLGKMEILHYYWEFNMWRYAIGFVVTFLLLAAMILLGIWFPAHKAVHVPPAVALREE